MSDLSQYLCCGGKGHKKQCVEYYRHKEIEWVCYGEWLPNLRVMTPHVVDEVLYDAIRRSCIEFVRKSRLLTRNILLELQNGVGDYYLCLGEREHIAGVRMLSINGCCYEAVGHTCSWLVDGQKFWFHPPNSLEIHPTPKESDKLILTVDALPREDSDEVDKLIYDHYFEAILQYAAAQMVLIPPASDAPKKEMIMSTAYSVWVQNFNQAVQRAKLEQTRAFSHGITTWSNR